MTHLVQHDVLITFTYDVLRQSCSSRRHRASHRRLNDENLAASVTHPFTCFPNEERSAIDCIFLSGRAGGNVDPCHERETEHLAIILPRLPPPVCGRRHRKDLAFCEVRHFVHDATRCATPIGARSAALEAPEDRSILRECSFRARASKRVRHGEGPQRQENNTEDGKHSDVREHRAERYAVDGDLPHRA